MPRLSVLLPVRDARPWLDASLASLARQTFRDFEIVAVDDGSRDGSAERLERHAEREPRLRVLHGSHVGLPRALARALAVARGELIARHDADDLSHRERFERQLVHLAHAPRVDVSGTRVRLFADRGGRVGEGMRRWARWHNRLLDHEAIRRELLIDSPLAHGTSVMRRGPLERAGGWREAGWAEDLDLWVRMAEQGSRFEKLPLALYGWRQHPGSSTHTDPRYAVSRFTALKCAALDRGLLAGGRRATLVGTGASLERWRDALGPRLRTHVVARRPSPADRGRLEPPVVLVFVAAPARERWRAALGAFGWRELVDFVFVA